MVQLKKTNQGGFLQTFIIIAVVLAITIVSVAYFVKNRGETARRDQAIALADQIASSKDSNKTDEGSNPAVAVESNAATVVDDGTKEVSVDETENLPATGPAEDAIVFVVELGILSAMVMYYVQSRRNLSRSL